ncbi:uncharacterized protein Bfra_011443 [Botrytis fragariae]|uniref:Uncharacterized protein n=1 Tax=Botrytis fragariae TaxID=1964551 RepID=A0A8H6AXN2_9HELO|nr:uncharacterized protein Bfra_011443 [Botrytis fragariae]KAF5875681.1 hypothetical protein Bfra_011443 [Botrytis fragariae]
MSFKASEIAARKHQKFHLPNASPRFPSDVLSFLATIPTSLLSPLIYPDIDDNSQTLFEIYQVKLDLGNAPRLKTEIELDGVIHFKFDIYAIPSNASSRFIEHRECTNLLSNPLRNVSEYW